MAQGERGGGAGPWVKVRDLGSDTFEYAAYEVRQGGHFVIRASNPSPGRGGRM